MNKLINNFLNNKLIGYIATILSMLTPNKVNKYLLISCGYIIILKLYEVIHQI